MWQGGGREHKKNQAGLEKKKPQVRWTGKGYARAVKVEQNGTQYLHWRSWLRSKQRTGETGAGCIGR